MPELERISHTKDSCRKCGTSFSFTEGVSCAKDLLGITGSVVCCPKCHSVYEAQIVSGGMSLGYDLTDHYQSRINQKAEEEKIQQEEDQKRRVQEIETRQPIKKQGFFTKLLTRPPSNPGKFHIFAVKCKRCGEIIQGQVNVNNDPSLEFDENGKAYYVCRKVLMGSGLCFQKIEVVFKFNDLRGLLGSQISGGEFVED